MTENEPVRTCTEIATAIAAAYVSSNALPPAELPRLVTAVQVKVAALLSGAEPVPATAPPRPAVPVAKSITPDFLICLEDGKKFRSLKRHLGTAYGLTPEAYREKWGLPATYPMVAPAYAVTRSRIAKEIGLGQKGVAA